MNENQNLFMHGLTVIVGSLHALTFNQWISFGVLAASAITALVNWYYKRENLKLRKIEIQQNQTMGEN